jgi:hypothetical protein
MFSTVTPVQLNGKTVFERRARFDMFGQGEVISSLFKSRRNITTLGPGDGYSGSRVFIDGNTYGYVFNPSTLKYEERQLGTGKILRRSGNPFEVLDASRQGRLEINLPTRTGFGKIMGWMEKEIGIGTAYATRFNLLEKLIVNPIKRFKALRDGSGVLMRNPYKAEFGVSKVLDSALGGDIPEVGMLGGRYVKVPGGGTRTTVSALSGYTMGIPNRIAVLC